MIIAVALSLRKEDEQITRKSAKKIRIPGEADQKRRKNDEVIAVVPNGKTTDATNETWFRLSHGVFTMTHMWKISRIYDKIVWKRNMFMLPFGKSGKSYINQVTYLLNECLHDSPLSNTSIKLVMVILQLLLQKPSKSSKTKDHIAALNRRMELWTHGDFQELLDKRKAIREIKSL